MRQGLPGGVADDLVGGQQAAERGGEIVGLTGGGGDGEHGPIGAVPHRGDGGDDEGPQGSGRGEIEPIGVGKAGTSEIARTGQAGVTQGSGQQTMKHG
ncbi:hypothetical protein Asi02nite_57350 [Asanoa siamensis]|uniref:Uncharacterized protein n=1 Tax=Asanoa siamensis TaxID=926357 RepID=A0ABQ4CY37_9ACTN|nr:hypothetical protein Asi02nite_57350 [Asanoa siamensis]